MFANIFEKKKENLLTVVVLGGVLTCVIGKHIPTFAGPYRFSVRTINNETEEYKPTGKIWLRWYSRPNPAKHRQPQYYWGKYFGGIEVTDDMRMEVRLSKWANNGWKRNDFVMNFNRMCSNAIIHARSLSQIVFGNNLKCPFPKTNLIDIRNQSKDIKFPHFPVMPYGRYLFTAAHFKGKENVGIFVADIDIIPRI